MSSTNDIGWNWEYLETLGYIPDECGNKPVKKDDPTTTVVICPNLEEIFIRKQDEKTNTDNAHSIEQSDSECCSK